MQSKTTILSGEKMSWNTMKYGENSAPRGYGYLVHCDDESSDNEGFLMGRSLRPFSHCHDAGHLDCAVSACRCKCHKGTHEMIIAALESIPSDDPFWMSGECDDLIETIRKLREEAE